MASTVDHLGHLILIWASMLTGVTPRSVPALMNQGCPVLNVSTGTQGSTDPAPVADITSRCVPPHDRPNRIPLPGSGLGTPPGCLPAALGAPGVAPAHRWARGPHSLTPPWRRQRPTPRIRVGSTRLSACMTCCLTSVSPVSAARVDTTRSVRQGLAHRATLDNQPTADETQYKILDETRCSPE